MTRNLELCEAFLTERLNLTLWSLPDYVIQAGGIKGEELKSN